jgi:hypothetical protein
MSKDILGSLLRVLVTVPEDRLGLVQDFARKLAGSDGKTWKAQGKLFLRKELIPEPEFVIDTIIRVDRSIRPSYPNWAKLVMHPELESIGPTEYNLSKVEPWLHEDQKDGRWTTGRIIYVYLNDTDMLKTCLGLRDLEEIQKKDITFFRKYFKGKAVFGWASVVRDDHYGRFNVPYLCEDGDKVILDWNWLDNDWCGNDLALCHASSSQT